MPEGIAKTNGRIEATQIDISAKYAGRLSSVNVNEGDEVTAGQEIASKVGYASMSYLKPGEISPFSVLFSKDDAPPSFARYVIEVRSSKADFQPGYTYRDLSVLPNPQARQDQYGFMKISGRVRNTGGQAAKFVQIYAVFYDQQGMVVGLASSYAEAANDAPLAAGAEARFEVQGIVFSGVPARYRLFAEGSGA